MYFYNIGFSEKFLKKVISTPKSYWWIFVFIITNDEGKSIGYLVVNLQPPKNSYVNYEFLLDINTIFISEEYRGNNISKKVIEHYMNDLSQSYNIGGFVADVAVKNKSSHILFEKLKFKQSLLIKDAFHTDDAIKYIKSKG